MIAQTTITVIYESEPWWHRGIPLGIAAMASLAMVWVAIQMGRDL